MHFGHYTPRLALALALTSALSLGFTTRSTAQSVSTFASSITRARGLAVDAIGQLYVTSRYPAGLVLRCTPPSNVMTTFASGIVDPIEMVFDDSGNLFVTDYDNAGTAGRIIKVTPGGVKSVFATIPNPGALTRDAAGNLYVGEYFNQKIDKITPAGVVSAYVPSIGAAGARLTMLYMDTDGTLYAGLLNGVIYKVGPGGSPVTVFNTSMASVLGFVRGLDGNWYASSYDNEEIFRITPAGVGTLYAGAHASSGHIDGALLTSRFYYPSGMLSYGGILYITEYFNNDIRAIDYAIPTRTSSWGRLKTRYR